MVVAQIFGERDSSNLNKISVILPELVIMVIKTIPRQTTSPAEDSLKWQFTPSGQFSLKTAVELICLNNTADDSSERDWIWKVIASNRVRHFLWIACQDKLPTKSNLLEKSIVQEECCPLCDHNREDT